jgi:hypothetical protein
MSSRSASSLPPRAHISAMRRVAASNAACMRSSRLRAIERNCVRGEIVDAMR